MISLVTAWYANQEGTNFPPDRHTKQSAISSDINFCKTRILSSSLDLPLSVEIWKSEMYR